MRTRLRILTLLASMVVVAVLVGWWVTRGNQRPAATVDRAADPNALVDAEQPTLTGVDRGEVRSVPAETTSSIPGRADTAGAVAFADNARTGEVRFVLVGEDGREQRSAKGQFGIIRWRGPARDSGPQTFEDGRWSSTFEFGETWSFDEIFVDRWMVVSDHGYNDRLDPSKGPIELRLHLYPPTILRVVDADSGIDLNSVDVRGDKDFGIPSLIPSSTSFEVVTNLPSPVQLRPSLDPWWQGNVFWVGAPGYGWRLVHITPLGGGTQHVGLVPSGSVEVEITGLDKERRSFLRVVPVESDEDGTIERPQHENGVVKLEGLSRGRYRASIGIGEAWRRGAELAAAEFEIQAGSAARVPLHVADVRPVVLASMSGTLTIPAKWNIKQPNMMLALRGATITGQNATLELDPNPSDSDDASTWSWKAGPLETGTYEFNLFTPLYKFVVELGPQGKQDVALVVAPPVDVVVRVIDDRTGAIAQWNRLMWHSPWPEGMVFGVSFPVPQEETGGEFRFQAPQGPVTISFPQSGFEPAEVTFDVVGSRVVRDIHVQSATRMILYFEGADRLLPRRELRGIQAVASGSDGRLSTVLPWDLNGVELRFTAGGKYSITLPEMRGFEPSAAFEVELAQGESGFHEMKLIPKR